MARPFARARVVFDDMRAAGAGELYWRAWAGLENRLGLGRRRFAAPSSDAFAASLPDLARDPEALKGWLGRRPSRFLFDPADRGRYHPRLQPFPSARPRADPLLDRAVLLFGRPLELTEPWDWHADPVSGHRWPASDHWTRLSVAGPAGADVRRVWERNRQRDLFVLGRAYWATGDERYAEAAAERLDRWREGNPPERGINWWSHLEVALHAIAWVWALHVFRDAPAFTGPRLWELVRLCWLAGRHLERGLPYSMRVMPGNHVIGDAAGLAVVALALPELSEATRWRRLALSILEHESDAQVAPDGAHSEESPAYHAFVWELLCVVGLLARKQGIQVPNTWRALERMAEALVVVARPEGTLPASGDDDGSVAFDLCEGASRAFTVGAVSAVLFDRPDLKAAVGQPSEAILWLSGAAGLDAWQALPDAAAPDPRVTGFGLTVRSSWARSADWWFLRGGTQSRHTHADALGLEVAVMGEVLLEETGTGSYNASPGWRRHARGTRAHNTVVIDGFDQARMHRTFRWLSPLNVNWGRSEAVDRGWYAEADHHGYRGLVHRRRVWWHQDWGWLVLDCLDGDGVHGIEQRWHTRGAVARAEDGVLIEGSGGAALQIVCAAPLVIGFEPAREGAHDGWIATDYTSLEPGTVVTARARQPFPVVLATFLCADARSGAASVSWNGFRIRLQAGSRVLDLEVPEEGAPRRVGS